MSSMDFTTRTRELGGGQQLLLPELAESRIDFGPRMWIFNLRSPGTVEAYTKTMTRFHALILAELRRRTKTHELPGGVSLFAAPRRAACCVTPMADTRESQYRRARGQPQ